MAPALFVDADNAMRIAREEIFGPVAAMIPARDYERRAGDRQRHAVRPVRRHRHHQPQTRARTSSATPRSAWSMVNLPTAGVDFHVPFGGRKGSSLGSREQGRYAVEFYTTVKTAYTPA